jgi:hypothetical protein
VRRFGVISWFTVLVVAGIVASSAGGMGAAESLACRSRVSLGVLPSWARGGFTEPEPRLPHVVAKDATIAALIFGYPLRVPPSASARQNKILWVARHRAAVLAPLRIRAQHMQGERKLAVPVTRIVAAGPGPSVINLPVAGCWRFTLRWAGGEDTLDLFYRARN